MTITATLPSEAIVKTADAQLEMLASQRYEAEQRLDTLTREQAQLRQEHQSLSEKRTRLMAEAEQEHRTVQQAEMDAKLAASSPIASATAAARLKEVRQNAKTASTTRQKELAGIEARQTAITQRLKDIETPITEQQAELADLSRQIELIRESRNRAHTALGQEVYTARIAAIDQARAHVEDLATQLMNAQVQLAREKDETLSALWPWAALREQAIRQYDLIADETTRILDAYVAYCNVLSVEGPKLVYRVGQHNVTRELELSARDLEILVNSPIEGRRILTAKAGNAQQMKHTYLDRPH